MQTLKSISKRYQINHHGEAYYTLTLTDLTTGKYSLGEFTTTGDPARALRRYLKQYHGITFYRGRTVTEYDGDVWEIIDRKTRRPLFAAVSME